MFFGVRGLHNPCTISLLLEFPEQSPEVSNLIIHRIYGLMSVDQSKAPDLNKIPENGGGKATVAAIITFNQPENG